MGRGRRVPLGQEGRAYAVACEKRSWAEAEQKDAAAAGRAMAEAEREEDAAFNPPGLAAAAEAGA